MKFSFVHAGELRLDEPFSGLGRVPQPIAEALRDASLHAFEALVDLTIERSASLLLITGSVTGREARHDAPSLRAQVHLRRGFERLERKGIRVVLLADGCGDPAEWPGLPAWPDNVAILSRDAEALEVTRGDHVLARLTRHRLDRTDEETLAALASPDAAGALSIAVLDADSTVEVDSLAAARIGYVALTRTDLALDAPLRESSPVVVAAGELQTRDASRPTPFAGGAFVVKAKGDAVTRTTFVPLARVRVVTLRVALDGDSQAAASVGAPDRFEEALREICRAQPDQALIVRGVIEGRDAPAADEVLRELRAQSERTRPHVWWDRIDVDPWPRIDRAALDRRGDFAADLARTAARYETDPAALEEFVARRTRRLDERGLQRALRPLDATARAELVRRAEKRALVLLEKEAES